MDLQTEVERSWQEEESVREKWSEVRARRMWGMREGGMMMRRWWFHVRQLRLTEGGREGRWEGRYVG